MHGQMLSLNTALPATPTGATAAQKLCEVGQSKPLGETRIHLPRAGTARDIA
jgi:hypothetical protein